MPVIEQERTEERQVQPASPEVTPEPVKRARPAMVVAGALAVMLMFLGAVLAISNTGGGTSPATPTPTPTPAQPKAAPTAAASVGVTLKEFTLTPGSGVGRAGRVTFKVHNAGAITHEFVVLRTTTPAAGLLKGGAASEAGNVGELGELKSRATKTVALNLKAGHYALICNLPGHYQAGQYADFVVR
jgi:uncharacterized cupredoxin-like copper-binding protein